MAGAAALLGGPTRCGAPVVHGDGRGGADARVPDGQRGRAGRDRPAGRRRSTPAATAGPTAPTHPAAISVGRRPTFYEDGAHPLVEAYLLDFDGDLYGEPARVSFVARLRGEERFESVDALVAQMHRDVRAAPGRWPPRDGRSGPAGC